MLTKKDYEAIAWYINDLVDEDNNIDRDDLVDKLSDYFEVDNPNFNRDLFHNACYEKEG